MPFPLEITFRDMSPTPAIEDAVRRWCAKLEHVHDRIERGHVTIARPHQRHRQGQQFHVNVKLSVPGPDVVVSTDHQLDGAHEDVYVAIRDAFRAARRQLQDHPVRVREVPTLHVEPAHGVVTYVDAEGAWGYLESEGRQIYFHHHSVLDDRPLEVRDEVRFSEERGAKGPQATTVERIGVHGHHEAPELGL